MKFADYLLLAGVVMCFVAALIYSLRRSKAGGCSACSSCGDPDSSYTSKGGCSSCLHGGCSSCSSCDYTEQKNM